jgi:hypothetical protein
LIPPLPKNYDVANRGRYSAGRLHPSKKPAKTKTKPAQHTTYGKDPGPDNEDAPLVPDGVRTPWIKGIGLSVTGLVFVFAVLATTSYQIKRDPFVASKSRFAASAILCVVLAVAASCLPTRSTAREPGWVPSLRLVGFGALAAGSIFMVVPNAWGLGGCRRIPASRCRADGGGWRLVPARGLGPPSPSGPSWRRRTDYARHAFLENPAVGSGGRVDRIGNVMFAAALVVLLFLAARRAVPGPV